jgi:hypothetical protein
MADSPMDSQSSQRNGRAMARPDLQEAEGEPAAATRSLQAQAPWISHEQAAARASFA